MKDMPPFSDLHKLSESDRIKVIGHYGMQMVVGFVVDNEKKADRYIADLKVKYPQLVIHGKAPMQGRTILVRVGPPVHLN